MMSAMPSWSTLTNSTNWQAQVSISSDHTLKSGMKENFHVPFGIGGGGSDPFADHTNKTPLPTPRLSNGLNRVYEKVVEGAALLKRQCWTHLTALRQFAGCRMMV